MSHASLPCLPGRSVDLGSVGYIHVLLAFRLPSFDSFYLIDADIHPNEVKQQLDNFLPFLMNHKSTLRYDNIRDAYSSVWERLGTVDVGSRECNIGL